MKLLIAFLLFAAWLGGLIIVGDQGYPSQYFWITGSFVAVGFAVAPFWRLRRSSWYWPTTALIEMANLGLLYSVRDIVANPELPPKGTLQLLFVAVILANWAVMVGVCWLISRQFPWQLVDEQ